MHRKKAIIEKAGGVFIPLLFINCAKVVISICNSDSFVRIEYQRRDILMP